MASICKQYSMKAVLAPAGLTSKFCHGNSGTSQKELRPAKCLEAGWGWGSEAERAGGKGGSPPMTM